jgi:poly-gamma-glutamate capsule biosynthesis protein CapA/YwtB (metallophosphatase superfamily)
LELVVDTAALYLPTKKDTISIIGVGDIMMGTNYPKEEYLPPKSWNLLDSVNHILEDADITFGNLEGVILNDGGTPKNCRNPDACYVFRSPEYVVDHLRSAGFDLMSLANNHAGDFGDIGRQNTMKILDSADIYYAGFLSKPFVIFEKENITYGFAAFAPNTGTVSINDIGNARAIAAHLDSLCDIVIISFHGGAEGKDHQHVTREEEIYYKEARGNVYAFSHAVIDEGADIVFGHGPHVTRSIEIYNNRFIAYSLGNFCTYARFNLRGPNGIAPIVKIQTNIKGEFIAGTIIPVKQIGLGIPIIDERRSVIFKIQELTHIDFPELKINIDDLGNINYLDFDF